MRSDVLHERREHDARFLARRVPVSARVVALVHAVGAGGRTAAAAAAIAHGVGLRREHTLLAGTGTGEASLDARLGGAETAGISGVLAGRARLTEIAVRGGDRSFVFLPAGEAPPPPAELVGGDAFHRFVERIRQRGGTLLLHVPESALEILVEGGLVDGFVTLGDLEATGFREVPEFGRVALEADEEGDAAASPVGGEVGAGEPGAGGAPPATDEGTPEPESAPEGIGAEGEVASAAAAGGGGWRRHRARSGAPVGRILAGVAVVAVVAVAWWLLADRTLSDTGPDPGPDAGPSMPAEAVGEPGDGPAAGREAASGSGEAASGGREAAAPDEAALRAVLEQAPALSYSVLIASYASPEDAQQRVGELREAGGPVLYLVSPTPVRGALYHRVFAGARADTGSAAALMRRLVASGVKERESAWDVRPVGLAYLLGVHATREEALAARRRAAEAGIPAYVLPAASGVDSGAGSGVESGPGSDVESGPGSGVDSVYALYAGAFESAGAAEALGALLEGASLSGELGPRRGASR